MHPRKLIRRAFRDRLMEQVNGVWRTKARDRVYTSRIAPVNDDDLKELGPAILIYSRMERIHVDSDYGIQGEASHIERDLQLVTEAMVTGGTTVDDDLDDLAEEIEAALDDWQIPGLESARVRVTETDIDLVTENVKRPIGAIGIVWQVRYRSTWRPRANPDDLEAILNPP